MKTQSAIENLINGNITDAKALAKNLSSWRIMTQAENMGFVLHQSVAIAGFLKGVLDFQTYCDTMNGTNKKNPSFL